MDEEQQRERADLFSRVFALITMKLVMPRVSPSIARLDERREKRAAGPRSSMSSSRRSEKCSPAQLRFLPRVSDASRFQHFALQCRLRPDRFAPHCGR